MRDVPTLLNVHVAAERGRLLGFARRGALLLLAVPRGAAHALVGVDSRDRSVVELHRSAAPLVAAVARDRGRVAALTEAELLVIDQAGARALACPFARGFSHASLGRAPMSPDGRFLAVGGWQRAQLEPRWRVAFIDLEAGTTWIPEDARVAGPTRWIDALAVVGPGLVCDPSRRVVEERAGADASPHASPSGVRRFEASPTGLCVRGPGGAAQTFPLTLDSFDELRWVDDRWLVHRWAPHRLVDAEGDLVALELSESASLEVAPGLRYAAWQDGQSVRLGDLAVLPVEACPVAVDPLPGPSTGPSVEAEALALEVARRAMAWGVDLDPSVRWVRPDDELALDGATPWSQPIERALREAHRGRDGHPAVFVPLSKAAQTLEAGGTVGRTLARLLLADGDWRSALAFDLLVPSGPLARTPFARLENPFEPALRLGALGCALLDVGRSGVHVVALEE